MPEKNNIYFEIKPVSKFSLGIGEIVKHYELFYYFTWRDIKIKYKQTFLGFFWAVLQPFFMMLIFTLFFGKNLTISFGNLPYPIFVYSGLLIWNIFASGLNSASNSMVSNAAIIKKIYFPRLIIPMSSVLVSLFDFFMALIVFVGLIIYYHQSVDLMVIVNLPLAILLTVFATFGLGCFLAALTIKYRDFRYVVPFAIQALMFLNPVF